MDSNNKKRSGGRTLERGLDLLELLTWGDHEKSCTQLSKESGFNIATTHRLLQVLVRRGYLKQHPATSRYRLSLKLFEFGSLAVQQLNIREEALPILKDLAAETGDTAYLIVMDNDEGLCLARIDGHHFVRVLLLQIGGRLPLYLGAGPKVLLAHQSDLEIDSYLNRVELKPWTPHTVTDPVELKKTLIDIRRRGYALSVEDNSNDVSALGCPVFGPTGDVVASVSISGLAIHYKGDSILKLATKVQAAANELSERLAAVSR
jgi:IclR family KDG regulon transcriptional repressor